MIAWLAKIGGLLSGLLTFFVTMEAQKFLVRSLILAGFVIAFVALFSYTTDVVRSVGQDAVAYAQGVLGGDGFLAYAADWINCITPASMPQAFAAFLSILLVVGVLKFTKWTTQQLMG
jgi:hypothetical protein